MKRVNVTFQVKYNSVKTEEMELMVDQETLNLASGSSSREKLSKWAENLFPNCEWAKVISMSEIR